jgi:anthranilate phosphoribosyltransferase
VPSEVFLSPGLRVSCRLHSSPKKQPMNLRDLLRSITPGRKDIRNLSQREAYRAFEAILSGSESEITVASFFVALRAKGMTVDELMGFASAARDRATLPCGELSGLVCLCSPNDGTENVPPLDVAAGLIAAGAGARVLIMSDRCVPPRRGLTAANVLEALGASMTWDPKQAEEWVARASFAACAVTGVLPELMALRRIREDVVMRTPLATVEKLICPSNAAVVIGAQGGPVLGRAVEVMQGLGHNRASAVQGIEGGVIPSVRRRTRGIELLGKHLVSLTVEPEDFGLTCPQEPDLPLFSFPPEGQGAGDNPALIKAAGEMTELVLAGEPGPARCAALLGAALTLKAAGRCMTLAEGVDAATSSIDSGQARGVLETLRGLTG